MAKLFETVNFGSLQLVNRIVIAPMCQYSATDDGEITYWHEQQWANYALSGAGLCIVEATAVQPEGRISYADLGLWNDQQRDQIKALLAKGSSFVRHQRAKKYAEEWKLSSWVTRQNATGLAPSGKRDEPVVVS